MLKCGLSGGRAIIFQLKNFFSNLFWAALGLRCRTRAFSSCGVHAPHYGGSFCLGAQAHRLQYWGAQALVAPRYVGSSWTKKWTRAPCIGRPILNHRTARGVPGLLLFYFLLAAPIGMRDLSSPTRDRTCALCSGSTDS